MSWFVRTLLGLGLLGAFAPSHADWVQARCDVYPAGEDHTDVSIPCTFSQRQGYITIARGDGVTHDLTPLDDGPGGFEDRLGARVEREFGLGDQGLIFRFPRESIFVYWDTSALRPVETDNPTAPFSTDEYDATTLLRCRSTDAQPFSLCPAGILRMEDRQASITVVSPTGERFTINFMIGYVNATNRALEAELVGDTWHLQFDNGETWEVPVAAIEGG